MTRGHHDSLDLSVYDSFIRFSMPVVRRFPTITLESATLRAELGSPYAVAFFGEGTSYNAAAVTGVEIMAGESHTSC